MTNAKQVFDVTGAGDMTQAWPLHGTVKVSKNPQICKCSSRIG